VLFAKFNYDYQIEGEMDGACSTHGEVIKIWLESLKGGDHSEDGMRG
jgi:hypothetical protein